MSLIKILIVDNDDANRGLLAMHLKQSGFQVSSVMNTLQAQEILDSLIPDLIILDWMLPDDNGDEWLKYLKKIPDYNEIPIIILTTRCLESDKIQGLKMGADDYMTKPFSVEELKARIHAVLRRCGKTSDESKVIYGDILLDMEEHRIRVGTKYMDINSTEIKILQFFMLNPDKVYNRSQLLNKIWRNTQNIDERAIDVNILRLRKTLAACGAKDYVQTVRGLGYRFSMPNEL